MTKDKVKITIIGAGIVGLAIVSYLSGDNDNVIVIEKEDSFGQGTSSRNSEIIHAGIYYKANTLKAQLCVAGKHLLYEFCSKNNIPCAQLGKIIIATSSEEEKDLHALKEKGSKNDVNDLALLSWADVQKIEGNNVAGRAGLFSPSTGIIDTHKVMKTLEAQINQKGALISYSSEVNNIEKLENGYKITLKDGYSYISEIVVNSAGLYAHEISNLLGIDYQVYYYKGEYFSYRGKNPLKHLIYPVPGKSFGLGIHSVQDLAGELKLGPNSFQVNQVDYEVNPEHKIDFYNSMKKILPWLEKDKLFTDQSGIRPKLRAPNQSEEQDFIIKEEDRFPGFINLIGIESPGVTACLAIGKYVAKLIKEK